MTEQQLQHELIMWFSQQWPNAHGLLFEVNNDTYTRNHAMTRRSIGMVPGVSDLILIDPNFGHIVGIELKAPGSRHEKTHIQNQIKWGKKIVSTGGMYIMSSELDTIKKVVTWIMEGKDEFVDEMLRCAMDEVEKKLETKNKTVTF
jgi:hypothetical protein